MKNKKIITFLVVLVFSVGGIFLTNNIYQNKNEETKTKKKKQNNLAIMIKEDGASDYTKSSSKDIPKGSYALNRDKSYCKNNGVIGDYDNTLGKISFSFIGTDSCFLYFDYEIPIIEITTLMTPNDTDIFEENGLRYEGANPNNYICLDNQKEGSCSNSSLLFRIIGLFNEEYSTDGSSSAGSKKMLKILDTNNYGGTSGKYWNSGGTNNWSTSVLKTELNGTYLTTLLGTSNINSKLSSAIANTKWHLGGASSSNYKTLTAEGVYTEERNTSAIYSGNPNSVYAKIGLMYPSDYGYATVGSTTTNRAGCRAKAVYDYDTADCKNNDWLFTSQVTSWGSNKTEWLISPSSSNSNGAAYLNSTGSVSLYGNLNGAVRFDRFAVRPTFYLDSSMLKIVGGTGTSTVPYHIG